MAVTRRKLLLALAALGPALSQWRGAVAQDRWPSRPIRFIVTFAPGGLTDVLARLVGVELAKQLGQPVVVENVTGAGGTIGTARLAGLPADGYSIGLVQTATMAVAPHMYKDVGYDPVRGLTPIARLIDFGFLLVVRADSPYRSLDELLAAARAKPGSITYSATAAGATTHLAGALLARQAKVDIVHVPYRGTAPAMVAVLGGEVQSGVNEFATAMPHLRAGTVRALATTGRKRHHLLPEVQTVAESLPGYEVTAWMGIGAPAGLPAALQQRLAAAAEKALATPGVGERLTVLGVDVNFGGPEELARALASDLALWGPVIKALGIRAE